MAWSMLSERLIVRFAKGLSQNRAIKAATTSQAIMTQKIVSHDPVFTLAMAATGPAKMEATPLAV
jgi:hypothetical protein